MPAEPTRRYVVSAAQVRLGYALGGIGAVGLLLALLVLATARPQGQLVTVDTSQHEASLTRAADALAGFELREDGSARIDIDHAMALVLERGVDLAISPAGGEPVVGQAEAGGAVEAAGPDGAALFAQNCVSCHQASGQGIPGAFPPLAGHVGDLVASDRAFPPKVVLFGMAGPITVNGVAYAALMPVFGDRLDDAELAAVLNHVLTAWGDADTLGDAFEPYTADELATWRELGLSNTDVHALRLNLTLP